MPADRRAAAAGPGADYGSTRAFAPARTVTLAATLGLAAACWVITVWQMRGMDMGVATRLGSFALFIAVWVAMMAAMMLPGAVPAVLRRAQIGRASCRERV